MKFSDVEQKDNKNIQTIIFEKSDCISTQDGEIIYNRILDNIKNNIYTILDFKETNAQLACNFNAAYGKLFEHISLENFKKYIQFLNLKDEDREKFDRWIDNSYKYYTDNKYRNAVDYAVCKCLDESGDNDREIETTYTSNPIYFRNNRKNNKIDININEYTIGDWVLINKTSDTFLSRKNKRKEIFTEELENPIPGKIVGIKKKLIGDFVEPERHYDWDGGASHDSAAYLTNTKTIYFWEVKVGLLNKNLLVLPENLERIYVDRVKDIPIFFKKEKNVKL